MKSILVIFSVLSVAAVSFGSSYGAKREVNNLNRSVSELAYQADREFDQLSTSSPSGVVQAKILVDVKGVQTIMSLLVSAVDNCAFTHCDYSKNLVQAVRDKLLQIESNLVELANADYHVIMNRTINAARNAYRTSVNLAYELGLGVPNPPNPGPVLRKVGEMTWTGTVDNEAVLTMNISTGQAVLQNRIGNPSTTRTISVVPARVDLSSVKDLTFKIRKQGRDDIDVMRNPSVSSPSAVFEIEDDKGSYGSYTVTIEIWGSDVRVSRPRPRRPGSRR